MHTPPQLLSKLEYWEVNVQSYKLYVDLGHDLVAYKLIHLIYVDGP
jgi:hypothetical protein